MKNGKINVQAKQWLKSLPTIRTVLSLLNIKRSELHDAKTWYYNSETDKCKLVFCKANSKWHFETPGFKTRYDFALRHYAPSSCWYSGIDFDFQELQTNDDVKSWNCCRIHAINNKVVCIMLCKPKDVDIPMWHEKLLLDDVVENNAVQKVKDFIIQFNTKAAEIANERYQDLLSRSITIKKYMKTRHSIRERLEKQC